MCNIAGYVGKMSAAPILIKMIRIQQGINAGFYTGLAVHDGKTLDYRKTIGDLDTLLDTTDADKLCGNTGIIHSRTPDGGDSRWSHPFVTLRDKRVKLAYVANGSPGSFAKYNHRRNAIADSLIADGYDIPCKIDTKENFYNRLSSGEAVHMSDVMCQLIYKYKCAGESTDKAMASAFQYMPSEIVGLAVDEEHSDRIYFSRINQPMFLGFDDNGAYLASSPIAFPESVKEYQLLPTCSSGVVYADHVEIKSFEDSEISVCEIDEKALKVAEETIIEFTKGKSSPAGEIFDRIEEKLACGKPVQADASFYITLARLMKEGRLSISEGRVTVKGLDAPKTFFTWVD